VNETSLCPAAITLLCAPTHTPILGSSPSGLLRQVEAAGLEPGRLVPPGAGEVTVLLPEAGWASRNLGALVAHQRAVPGQSAELLEVAGADRRSSGIIARPGRRPPREPAGGAPRRALLAAPGPVVETVVLDRDGTLIVDRNYLADPDLVTLLPGAVEGLRRLEAVGIRRVVVTNQSGVARGWIAPDALTAVHARLRTMLAEQGATLDGIFACPHREEDNCDCRKPKVGLTRQAEAALGLDLRHVVVAGDKPADLGLARALGVPAFLVMTGSGPNTLAENSIPADFVVDRLDDLARIVTHPAGVGRPVVTHSS
jgi:D-glycero-D-manno-heptose 1,7-bisphosphate phosphatase